MEGIEEVVEVPTKQRKGKGRPKSTGNSTAKTEWEETISVVMPRSISGVGNDQANEMIAETEPASELKEEKVAVAPTKKPRKGVAAAAAAAASSVSSTRMEVENEGNGEGRVSNAGRAAREKLLSGNWKQASVLCQQYSDRMDNARDAILQENFEELAYAIDAIVRLKIRENKQFVSYIQLIVEKSHLDLLKLFHVQVESIFMLSRCQSIAMLRYAGSNTLYKMLTFFKDALDAVIAANRMPNATPVKSILCVFEGAYNLSRRDLNEIGKFLNEEYEEYASGMDAGIQVIFLLPMSASQSIADIQCFNVDFAKSKDLFVRFLLFLLQTPEIPLPNASILLSMLSEFDLYSISYSEQVRRIKMIIFDFIHVHASETAFLRDLASLIETPRGGVSASTSKAVSARAEIKAAVFFLEKLFEDTSASIVDSKHRVVDIALNAQKNFVMTQAWKDRFIADADDVCATICDFMEDAHECVKEEEDGDHEAKEKDLRADGKGAGIEFEGETTEETRKKKKGAAKSNSNNQMKFFDRYIDVIGDIDAVLAADEEKNRKRNITAQLSRYDKQQQIKKSNMLKTKDASGVAEIKCEKVQGQIRELVQCSIHVYFKQATHSLLQSNGGGRSLIIPSTVEIVQRMYRPDFLGEVFAAVKQQQIELNEKKIVPALCSDGIELIGLCEENGRDIGINESCQDFVGHVREKQNVTDKSVAQSAFYNASCELKFIGLVQAKKKLKKQFIKHFYAKTSYFNKNISF